MTDQALPCIICGHRLRNVTQDVENQPEEGIACISHGNYGSTVFDPMDGTFLEFNICDECLKLKGEQGVIITARDRIPLRMVYLGRVGSRPVEPNYVPWHSDLVEYDNDGTEDISDVIVHDEPIPNSWQLVRSPAELRVWYLEEEARQLGTVPEVEEEPE